MLVFAAVATVAVLVPSPLGGNVGRMEDALALPLAVGLLWPLGPATRRLVLPLVAVPLILSQWGPAWGAMTTDPGQPSTHRSFYTPLLTALTAAGGRPAGGPGGGGPHRVPLGGRLCGPGHATRPGMGTAARRGRQSPVLRRGRPTSTPASYRAWLLDNGVRYVALPHAPLDFAGIGGGPSGRRRRTRAWT